MSEMAEQVDETSQNNMSTAKQEPIEDVELAINIPESLKTDTGHPLPWQTVLKSTLQQGTDQDEQDTDVLHDDDDHIAIDPIADGTLIQLEKSTPELLPTNDVTIPGFIFITRHLWQFLEGYPLPSDKQAFLDIYHY